MTTIGTQGRPREDFRKDLHDLAAGLSLLYIGPDGSPDKLILRTKAAMERGDDEEVLHTTAMILACLIVKGVGVPANTNEQWVSLSREYHASFCPDCNDNEPEKILEPEELQRIRDLAEQWEAHCDTVNAMAAAKYLRSLLALIDSVATRAAEWFSVNPGGFPFVESEVLEAIHIVRALAKFAPEDRS
ncbi:MAG: hypothetical protein KAW17_09530 [Candidatus Eisenbacteria sp.]|nr:hypothetical protein [Candidatus Eisenbacteria bacterium]